jgi:hypothetical protein
MTDENKIKPDTPGSEVNQPTDGSTEAGSPSRGRRRLLKAGVAAVPVVITLKSHSAWAVSCFNDPANPVGQSVFISMGGTGCVDENQDPI